MSIKEKLITLSEASGVSGYENEVSEIIKKYFSEFTDEIYEDIMGNVIALKKGNGSGKKIMLMAHMDEIGLMLSNIDKDGRLRFSTLGGFDPRTLIYQDVIIHSKNKKIDGIIVPEKPTKSDGKAVMIPDLRIDTGYKKDEIEKIVEIGDIITIDRKVVELQNNYLSGKTFDDRACLGSLLIAGEELKKFNHDLDVYFVASVEEEVGTRGAATGAYGINPDMAIAIDVTFGRTLELAEEESVEMDKGVGFTLGGNIHHGMRKFLMKTAEEYSLPYQIEITPGPTGTDARSIQITRQGIPTILMSVPLRYMHTSTETISEKDVISTGKLIARFIAEIDDERLEELLCY
ncbi:MAG: M42 family metallopeptidase [Andreesenia angusta]|nr:M42 family metallopeptidase [Andreesenia angusta]